MFAQTVRILRVVGIVRKTAEMHAKAARQMTQHMEGANLVALVRWKGHAMRKEQQVFHSAHPIPRTMGGPKSLVNGTGKRRHRAMKAWNFGLSGFTSGIRSIRNTRLSSP